HSKSLGLYRQAARQLFDKASDGGFYIDQGRVVGKCVMSVPVSASTRLSLEQALKEISGVKYRFESKNGQYVATVECDNKADAITLKLDGLLLRDSLHPQRFESGH
ncbi:hypothetical protein PFISCL1PPCAC_16462, partial [Pristionchus fissidentatus]